MKTYCYECDKDVNAKTVQRNEVYTVYGDKIPVVATLLLCPNCKSEIANEEMDDKTLTAVYNKYRKKHGLLLPEEIKEIRNKYNLSQRAMSRLLNWGDKTIARYERGSLQDKNHNTTLKYINDPVNLKEYIANNETQLSESELTNLTRIINQDIQDKYIKNGKEFIKKYYKNIVNSIDEQINFSYKKFSNTILYFTNKDKKIPLVKLLKEIFYSDFINMKEFCKPITGSLYMHYEYGPVPWNYELIFNIMEREKLIKKKIEYQGNYEYHFTKPLKNFDIDLFTKNEIKTLNVVFNYFKDFGSKDITKYSHNEKAYKDTKMGDAISYNYAKYITLKSD